MAVERPCFHCGEPLPGGAPIYARLGDLNQPVCCVGCKAVAEFIHSSGLDAFYEHRSAPRAEFGLRAEVSEWRHYDRSDLRERYVHVRDDRAEASIDIGGMYCSACVWLLDNALDRIVGVSDVAVNPVTRRAIIRWDIEELPFSQLLDAISQVGFKPQPLAPGLGEDGNVSEQRTALRRLIVAAAAGMQVMMFAVALYAGASYGIDERIEQFLRVISLLVCLPIVFYSARPFFAGAWRGLRARSPGMDVPVALAIAIAFFASVRATLIGSGDIYFDSVAMFVLFLSGTRYLEMRARHRSDDSTQALARMLPEVVTRLAGGEAKIISLDQLEVGDTVLIRPGDVIPADGTLLSGELAIDESLLTGESMPVVRKAGMDVFAGSINRMGNASIDVTLTGASTSLAEVGRLLERAKADRPRVAQLADRIAGKFVIAVLGIAATTGMVWSSIDPSRAFEIVLATLVVTCPCALALATPAALAAAASRLARDGFLLVRSRVLDVLTRRPTVVFDKTGTLTEGRPTVRETDVLGDGDAAHWLQIAAAIETASEHVLARAFAEHHVAGGFDARDQSAVLGCGVEAIIDGQTYRIGSERFVAELSGKTEGAADNVATLTQVWLGNEQGLLARFSISDEIRDDAETAIGALKGAGFPIMIASGDRGAPVEAIAKQLAIDEWRAGLTPADKVQLVDDIRLGGSGVLMVGDGINDAPVLAAADASIAIDAGTALARASADAVVVGKRLSAVVDAVEIADRTRRIIRQNIGWAIGYNLTAVPLAVSGLLAPWMAAIGMSLSSLIVVGNALRLQSATIAGRKETSARKEPLTGEAVT